MYFAIKTKDNLSDLYSITDYIVKASSLTEANQLARSFYLGVWVQCFEIDLPATLKIGDIYFHNKTGNSIVIDGVPLNDKLRVSDDKGISYVIPYPDLKHYRKNEKANRKTSINKIR